MFYALLGLWLIACVICELLTHLQQKMLSSTGSYIALAGIVGSVVLLFSGYQIAGLALLALAFYFWAIIRWSIHKQKAVSVKV